MVALLFFKTYGAFNEVFWQLSQQNPQTRFLHINLSDPGQERLARLFNVRAAPTILLLEERKRLEGYLSLDYLQRVLHSDKRKNRIGQP